MLAVGVNAATDVTGFGLIGHAREMADASGMTLILQTQEIPLLTQALDLARKGCLTRTHKSTLAHLGERLHRGSVEEALVGVLADAQTSGGLLISVAANRADALLTALTRAGVQGSRIIGETAYSTGNFIELK
jgi:selenide,water dikinase